MSQPKNGTVVELASASSMPLSRAWLLYANHDSSFMTEHPVLQSKSGPVIGAGQPATVNGVREALLAIDQRSETPAFLPPEVLCATADLTVWWRPAMVKRAFLRLIDSGESQTINIPMPALCYCVDDRSFQVFALKRRSRPKADTLLYLAPLLNVYESGSVCMGNVDRPKETGVESIGAWEAAFWHSTFTHSNGRHQINRKGGLETYWKACSGRRPPTVFDNDWLVSTKRTVTDLITGRC
ncbi:MAG: PRTRC system protein B [Betaproteobacteria bacterium]|jgi:PRTRC genetic system protein B|nr:PRTRC system protein B [Betaproteobacteria bacterium]